MERSYLRQFCYNLKYYLFEKLEEILKYCIESKIDMIYMIFKKLCNFLIKGRGGKP